MRGLGTSSTPEHTDEKLAELTDTEIPGSGDTRENRVSGIGALQGIATGVAVGGALGVFRSIGLQPRPLIGAGIATVAAMALSDGVMTGLGVTDPTTWAPADWAADIVPHLAYGLVVAAVLER